MFKDFRGIVDMPNDHKDNERLSNLFICFAVTWRLDKHDVVRELLGDHEDRGEHNNLILSIRKAWE
jgi:hypothetical protein